jgi:beta-lactamase regulating signal transducer with metallopeptidase domain
MNLASFIEELPSMVFAIAGKGALISLAALGIAASLRRASAASRHLVLALAAVLLLLVPVLTAVLPSWDLSVLPRIESREISADPPAARASMPGLGAAPDESGFKPHSWGAAGSPATLSPGLLPLAVSLLLLIRLALAVRGLSRLRTSSRPASAEWQALLDRERRRLGIARPVRLAVSSSVTVPVTFGWRRPLVLIPEGALGWEEQPLREALVHELSHVRRGDWPVQMIARAACALHWLDPVVWLLCRRLLLEAELACDDQVLRAGTGAEGYAERLVALARQVRETSRRPASAVAFARPSGLASRVESLLDAGRRRGGPSRLAVAGAAGVALLLLLLVAPAHLVRAEPVRPRAIEQGVEQGVEQGSGEAFEGDALEQAVEQGVSGALKEDTLWEGIRYGIEEGRREALIEAAADGDLNAVRFLLQEGMDPNTVVPHDGTPLIVAARAGQVEVVRLLLTAGAYVDQVVPGDENPLIQAAWNGRLEVARLLLDAGADPNVRVVANRSSLHPDGELRTPLRMARRGGHQDLEQLLLEHGAKD